MEALSPVRGNPDQDLNHLFGERLLPPGDDEEVVEEDEVHLGRFAGVEQRQRPLHQDLAPRRHDQPLARLLRQRSLGKQSDFDLVICSSIKLAEILSQN